MRKLSSIFIYLSNSNRSAYAIPEKPFRLFGIQVMSSGCVPCPIDGSSSPINRWTFLMEILHVISWTRRFNRYLYTPFNGINWPVFFLCPKLAVWSSFDWFKCFRVYGGWLRFWRVAVTDIVLKRFSCSLLIYLIDSQHICLFELFALRTYFRFIFYHHHNGRWSMVTANNAIITDRYPIGRTFNLIC